MSNMNPSSYLFYSQRNKCQAKTIKKNIHYLFILSFRLDPEIRMQSREIRLKNFGYQMAFMARYAGVMLFISYRLRSDDLDTLEKEAEERIMLNRQIKQLQNSDKKH